MKIQSTSRDHELAIGVALESAAPNIEYRTVDKSEWGPGPWQDEPDKRQWTDAETGFPCLIVRGPSGALCGYAGVNPGHPAYGLGYDHSRYGEELEVQPLSAAEEAINAIEAHGGLTFAGGCRHGADPSQGICHIPPPGTPDHVWWFGFDCAHCDDLTPSSRRRIPFAREVYRDVAYVEAQVAGLALQLAAIAASPGLALSSAKPAERDSSRDAK